MSRIAIIGAGAAGTLTAVHLMREPGAGETELVLIDRAGAFGPGVAYATREPNHLLNVPAVRMGGIAGDPEHFHAWLQERGHQTGPAAFVPRGYFGDYLLDLLAEAEAAGAGRVRLRRLSADATALAQPAGPAGPLQVRFSDGPALTVDRAVLAIGALPAGDPAPVPERLRANGVYVANPWAPGALEEARGAGSVVAIGTGLTMVDVALTLARDGGGGPSVCAISRSGLVPRRHREDLTHLQPFPLPRDSGDLAPVIAAVLEQIGRAGQRGCDWRDVLDSMRPATPAIWRGLRVSERRRFLAELQRFWDVHRFRMAPEVADAFEGLTASGSLRVAAGAILAVEPSERGAYVKVRQAGREAIETIECERLINCTGAGSDVVRDATPLVADLLASGMARPDPLSLGLDVAPGGALVDDAGRPSDRVHVVGCLRKGVEWEAIGVTEIRDHAAAIAAAAAPAAGRVAA